MPIEDYDIVGGFNRQRFVSMDAERSVNLFEFIDTKDKKPKTLLSTSGLLNTNLIFNGATNGFRAQFVVYEGSVETMFVVIGKVIYSISQTLAVTPLNDVLINPLTTEIGYVGIEANNGNSAGQIEVIFVDGDKGYIYNLTTKKFLEITDPGFPADPIDVTYLDGFFVVAHGGTPQFQLSEFNEGLIWGPDGGTPTNDTFVATSGSSPNLVLTTGSTANYQVGTLVKFTIGSGGALPIASPVIVADRSYFVVNVINATTFTISTTSGGAPITFTTTGTPVITVSIVSPAGNEFIATSGSSPNLVLITGSTLNYQVGTPIRFDIGAGGVLPVASPVIVAGIDYYVQSIVNSTTFTISATSGGPPILFTTTGTPIITLTNGGQLQLAQITSHPGTIVALRTLHRRLFIFSQNFTEVWENAGEGTNLPFRRNNGLLMEYGTPAIGSIAVGFDKMFFLSQDRDGLGAVMEVVGTESAAISERPLDYDLAQFASDPLIGVSDARAFLIKENGLIFYRLNFTKANHTYVFNLTMSDEQSKRWHEEEVLNGDRHPAQTHGYFYGRNYVGSYASAKLFLVDDSYLTNDGEAIRRMRIPKPFYPPTGQRVRCDRFQLDLLQGQISASSSVNLDLDLLTEDNLELLTESGDILLLEQSVLLYDSNAAPTVFLSVSKDGGQSYGYRIVAPMGAVGQRTFRTVWRKLGSTKRGQAFVPKIEFFNETPFVILGATWFYEILPE